VIKLSFGLAHGPMWLLPGVDVFGEAATVAFELGENIAHSEILVSSEVGNILDKKRFKLEWRSEEIAGREVQCASISSVQTVIPPPIPRKHRPIVNPAINVEEPAEFVRLIGVRQLQPTKDKAKQVDEMMKKRFNKDRAVLIIQMHEEGKLASEMGMIEFIGLVMQMKTLCGSIVDSWHGQRIRSVDSKVIAQIFALFDSGSDAIYAAVHALHACRNLPCKMAAGIGYSEVLDLDACNAFGDGVNMAFKLGEDTAEAGEILFTNNIKSFLPRDFEFKLEPRQVSMSGVTIDHQCIVMDAERAAALVHTSPQPYTPSSTALNDKGATGRSGVSVKTVGTSSVRPASGPQSNGGNSGEALEQWKDEVDQWKSLTSQVKGVSSDLNELKQRARAVSSLMQQAVRM
jgi:class 3 adenylate cyclase